MQIFYTVRAEDTLYNIAGRFSILLKSLINSNNLIAPYTIYIGQQLSMPPGVNTYVVAPGDSVYSISQKYGIPAGIILEANGIVPPYIIVPGQVMIIPPGVPYYIVRPGDTLYRIASRYNITVNGQPRPDLIIAANPGLTSLIMPGMTLALPYPPPGGGGSLAVILNDNVRSYLGFYEANTGNLSTLPIEYAGETSRIYWSPDQTHIAYIDNNGLITIIETSTRKVSKIDQISVPGFVDWAPDSRRVAYSDGKVIKIYDVVSNSSKTINRSGTQYVQWFLNGAELLYEAKDAANFSQLYRNNIEGIKEVQITNNAASNFNNVRLSPNGSFVLYTTPGVSISDIYTIELATGNTYKIPGGPEAKNYYPAWSPDSNKIAYASTQFINGKYYSLIRVSGSKGENDTTVAVSRCYSTPVTWSPDSKKIAYLSGCREEYRPLEVWSVDIRKLVPINLLYGFTFYYLDWSPTR
jgi:TolB protein